MGSLIGGVIGGVGSLLGGGSKKKADTQAAGQSLAGYNYLTGNQANQTAQSTGMAAAQGGAQTQGIESSLLTPGAGTPQAKSAFNNYLNSTGYKFGQQQGTQAITGSAAARGILNSGATAKALQTFGQGTAGQAFGNYLGSLNTLNTQQQNTANTGANAATAVGQAGTAGGGNAAAYTQAGGAATATGYGGAVGAAQGILTSPQATNFFASI